MKTSQGTATRSSASIVSTPSNSVIFPPAATWSCRALASIPASFRIAPLASETADHLGAELLHDPGCPRADVAEALDDEARVGRAHAEVRRRLAKHVDAAAARGRLAAVGPLEGDRLAGEIAGVWPWSLPYSSIIQAITWALVLTSGAGMSRVGPRIFSTLSMNERVIFCTLGALELVGGAVDAALGAAERDAGDGGLPGHQRGQRADLVDVDLGVEADAALVRAPGAVVLDAVAGEDVDLAVGELDRDLHGDLAVRRPEDDAQVVRKLEAVAGDLEVVADDVEVGDLGALTRLRLAARLRLGLRPPRPPAATCRGALARLPVWSRSPSSPSHLLGNRSLCIVAHGVGDGAGSVLTKRQQLRPGAIAQLGERRLCIRRARVRVPLAPSPRAPRLCLPPDGQEAREDAHPGRGRDADSLPRSGDGLGRSGCSAGAASVDASWHVGASAGQYASDGSFVSEDGAFDPSAHSYRRKPSYGVQSRLSVRALVVKGPDGTRLALVTERSTSRRTSSAGAPPSCSSRTRRRDQRRRT